MAAKIYWIHAFENNAKIGNMARPRGGEWLMDDLISLKKQNIDTLVSLLEKEEVRELDLNNEAELCQQVELEFISFPIPDRDIPPISKSTSELIYQLSAVIQSGRNLVIHCRMGIGRSSIIAGAVMIANGYSVKGLIEKISVARGLKVPDTKEQEQWLLQQRKI